jgi:hypothetical protein
MVIPIKVVHNRGIHNKPSKQMTNTSAKFNLDAENNCYVGENDSVWLSIDQMQRLTGYNIEEVEKFLDMRDYEKKIHESIALYPFYTAVLLVEWMI